MPRPHRTNGAGAAHHVMIRGVEGRAIFSRESEIEALLAHFATLVREVEFLVLAWCLLGNHAHFVLKQRGEKTLGDLMACLNSRHAQSFNRNNNRAGHLFQDRYKAVLIESEEQLVGSVPYVLGNVVRHGLGSMAGLVDYPWSGYSALIGRRSPRAFESADATLEALGVDPTSLPELVEQAALEPAAMGAALEPDQIDELNRLIRDCCRRHGVSAEALHSGRKDARAVRIELCSLAVDSLDLPLTEIARHSGISYDTVRRFAAKRSAKKP
jgi:REP element-mobilizing transposase RayT